MPPPVYYADPACERARCYLASLFDTPSPSAAPSITRTSAASGTRQPSADDIQIHEELNDTVLCSIFGLNICLYIRRYFAQWHGLHVPQGNLYD